MVSNIDGDGGVCGGVGIPTTTRSVMVTLKEKTRFQQALLGNADSAQLMCVVSGLSYMMNRNNAKEEGSKKKYNIIKKNEPFIRASGTLHLSYTQRKGRRGRRLQKHIIPIIIFDWRKYLSKVGCSRA